MARTVAIGAALLAASAQAQSVSGSEIVFEATTDRRERGLSWSDGKPAVGVSAVIPVGSKLTFDLEAVTLRESPRHGGADVSLTLAPRYVVTQGGRALGAGVRASLFVGRSGTSYVELTGDIEHTIGPLRLIAGIDYAPSQKAIAGENLHVEAQASAGIPGMPLSLYGGVGHSTGSDNDKPRALRLRPGGSYTDYHFGIEHSRRLISLGLRYSDTSISGREVRASALYLDRHYGSRLVIYLRIHP